jgi:flagellar motility protein MotE (MotC chaperone)
LSHFLTVLRDSPVSFAICAVGEFVAQFHAPDLAYHVHGDHLFALLKISATQWNTLVNFGSALLALGGQFSVGVNTQRQLNAAKIALEAARDQLAQVKGACEQEAADKRDEFAQQKEMAQRRRERDIAEVEARIASFKKQQSKAIEDIEQERDKVLQSKGVDGEDRSGTDSGKSRSNGG